MEYVELNNGINMPLVGLGTWDLRGDECVESVSRAIDLGYRLVDTAQMYGNETEVGLGIQKSGIDRKDLFVTTKMYSPSNSYEKANKAIEISLERLKLDYIDLFLLHEPYRQGLEMYRALQEAYHMGRVKAIGISNYNERWYTNFMKKCEVIPAVNQLECHPFFQKWDYQKLMEEKGTKMQAWAPLAQGIGNIAKHPLLGEIGQKYNKTAAQTALRFLVQRGISVIPKSKSESRLKENIDVFDFTLTDDDIKKIMTLDRGRTLFSWTEAF